MPIRGTLEDAGRAQQSVLGERRIQKCMPIGRLALVSPHGMLIPGMPARLAVIV